MQHSLNEVIQLLTSNTVPVCVCVCAGCPLALSYLQTLAQSGLPQSFSSIQPRIQLPKSLLSMLHTSSRPRWPFILQIPNWNQSKTTWAGQSQSWEAFLLSGFFSVWGVHVENFFSWLHPRILNAYRRDQKSFQPSTKTTFTHSHRKRADFWQKGQNPLYILIFYATFISPHHTMQPNIVFCSQRKT